LPQESTKSLLKRAESLESRIRSMEDASGAFTPAIPTKGLSFFKKNAARIINRLKDMRQDQVLSGKDYKRMNKTLLELDNKLFRRGKPR